jgi:hypothetical protein
MIVRLKFINRDTGEIVPLVHVVEYDRNTPTGKGTAADINGMAEIDKTVLSKDLRAMAIGYHTEFLGSLPTNLGAMPLDVILTPKIAEVPEVIIETKREKKPIFGIILLIAVLAILSKK